MAASWCLIKPLAQDFKARLKSGEIDPEKLSLMTSTARHAYFASFLGEDNALKINSLFESKMLLKSQQTGMVNWAKKVANMSQPARRDVISKIEKMDKILNPEEEKAFLQDLASTKLGSNVSLEEAQKITEMSSKVQNAKEDLLTDPGNKDKQVEYGKQIYDMQKGLEELQPVKTKHTVANIASAPRTLLTSLDFATAPFHQGFFAMSNPAWIKNYVKIPSMLLGEKNFRVKMGEIYGSPYYDALVKGGLRISKVAGDISKQEEGFASNMLNKFGPVKASKRAFTGFINGLRMDMGVSLLKAAELRGDDIGVGSKLVKDFSTMINNLTGAASLGRFENAAPEINMAIFSARKQVAMFNTLNPGTYLNPKTSPAARAFAFRTAIGSLAISTILIGLAKMAGLQAGTDPNKTDFGEITIGNTHIDTTGGSRVMITLLSRILSGKYVSLAGKTTELGVGYKSLNRLDLLTSYALGKLTPGIASTMADFMTATQAKAGATPTNSLGQPVTPLTEIKKNILPMNIANGIEMMNNDPTNSALGIALGLFGVPVSTSSAPKSKWKR